uniref:TSA: Wollemia nobilis Ref_Wollemi_Transcript_8188_1337 transcribed RNA sequence n=1 Tax=Wollemia nobilis TaxID=56998 RepID=A0A0C9RNK7_9CONI
MASDRRDNQGDKEVKYLGFFMTAAVKTKEGLGNIYAYAKENSGPLKEGVDAVEGRVRVVVGPLYSKIEGKPYHLLQFLDKTVDDVFVKVDSYVPPTLKSKTCQVYGAAKKAPEAARSVVADVREVGVVGKAKEVGKTVYAISEPRAKDLYNKYEPVAEQWSLAAWYKLRQFPLVPAVVEALIPPTTYCIEKYNTGVQYLTDGEYRVATYLPMVPAEKIKNTVYKGLGKDESKDSELPKKGQVEESVDSSEESD